MQVKFPLFVTLAQPGTTTADEFVQATPSDVYLATYSQGERLEDDRLEPKMKVVADSSRQDETLVDTLDKAVLYHVDDKLIYKPASGKARVLRTQAEEAILLPDGQGFVAQAKGGLVQHDLAEKQERELFACPEDRRVVDFQLDREHNRLLVALGSQVGYSAEATEIVGVPLVDGQAQCVCQDVELHLQSFAVSPDGNKIAYVNSSDKQVYCRDLDHSGGYQVSIPRLEEEDNEPLDRRSPSFSPDSSRVLYCRLGVRYGDGYRKDFTSSLYAAPVQGGDLVHVYGDAENEECMWSAKVA